MSDTLPIDAVGPVPPVGPVPAPTSRIPLEFPSVDPNVRSENYRYTITKTTGQFVQVTSDKPSVKILHEDIYASASLTHLYFPEAVVRVATIDDVIAGWPFAEPEFDEDEEEEEDDDPPPPPSKRRKLGGWGG